MTFSAKHAQKNIMVILPHKKLQALKCLKVYYKVLRKRYPEGCPDVTADFNIDAWFGSSS